MRQPRRTTDFTGWQSHLDYLADEAEREKREQATIALYQRETKPVPVVTGKWLIRLVIVCAICVVVIGWRILEALKP